MAKPKPDEMHVQCKLRRGTLTTVSWIPSRYAKKGTYLKLKDDDGVWENGWEVIETWGKEKSTDVLARAEFHKTHRDGTDRYRDDDGGWTTRKERVR